MANLVCCACKKSFGSLGGLHLHVKKTEKLETEDYYHLYYPKRDLFTNELINYKDNEQYFSTFFNSKENMSLWFKANLQTGKAKSLAKEILRLRAEKKGLKFAPSQVELRTVAAPSICTYEKLFDYNQLCQDLNLLPKFEYKNVSLTPYKDIKILIDTREQLPFSFKSQTIHKLDVGDYTAAEPHYADVYIDRKSVQDFYGTFFDSAQVARFSREVERAKSYGFYLFVLVEGAISEVLNYKSIFLKAPHVETLTFHNVRDLIQKFDNLQFVFSFNKFTAQELVTRILNQGEDAKKYDWQYMLDMKLI